MKKAKWLVFILLCVVIAALSYTSVFGISYWYGDIKNTVIRGIADNSKSFELGESARVIFGPTEDVDASAITDEQLDTAAERLASRLASLGYGGGQCYPDYDTKTVVSVMQLLSEEDKYDFNHSIKSGLGVNRFTIREGAGDKVSLDTEDNVLVDSEDLESVAVTYRASSTGSPIPVINLHLKEESHEKWREATERLTAAKGYISLWMDDVLILTSSAPGFDEGVISVMAEDYDASAMIGLGYTISLGALPFEAEIASVLMMNPVSGAVVFDAALVAVFALFLAGCLVLIVRYRFAGLAAAFASLLSLTVVVIGFTGYFSAVLDTRLSIGAVIGIAAAAIISLALGGYVCETARGEVSESIRPSLSLVQVYRRCTPLLLKLSLVTALFGFCLILVFGGSVSLAGISFNAILRQMGYYTVGSGYGAGVALLVAGLANMLVFPVVARLMMISGSHLKIFSSPAAFGKKS